MRERHTFERDSAGRQSQKSPIRQQQSLREAHLGSEREQQDEAMVSLPVLVFLRIFHWLLLSQWVEWIDRFNWESHFCKRHGLHMSWTLWCKFKQHVSIDMHTLSLNTLSPKPKPTLSKCVSASLLGGRSLVFSMHNTLRRIQLFYL